MKQKLTKLSEISNCSIIKDPYYTHKIPFFTRFKHKLNTFITLRQIEFYFDDFTEESFEYHAKQIYDEVVSAVSKKQYPFLSRSIDQSLFQFNHNDFKLNEKIIEFKENFYKRNKNWKIVNARINSVDIDGVDIEKENNRIKDLKNKKMDLNKYSAQITLRFYKEPEHTINYIVFERNLFDRINFYGWKITCLKYKY